MCSCQCVLCSSIETQCMVPSSSEHRVAEASALGSTTRYSERSCISSCWVTPRGATYCLANQLFSLFVVFAFLTLHSAKLQVHKISGPDCRFLQLLNPKLCFKDKLSMRVELTTIQVVHRCAKGFDTKSFTQKMLSTRTCSGHSPLPLGPYEATIFP
jgi:hypothetical protein